MVKNSFFFVCLLWAGSIVLGSCKKNKSEEPEPSSPQIANNTCQFSGFTIPEDDNDFFMEVKETAPNGNIAHLYAKYYDVDLKVEYDADNRIEKMIIKDDYHKNAEVIFEYNPEGKVIKTKSTSHTVHDQMEETTVTYEYSGNTILQTFFVKVYNIDDPSSFGEYSTLRKKETDDEGNLLRVYANITLPDTDKDTFMLESSFSYSTPIPQSFMNTSTVLWNAGLYAEEEHHQATRLLVKQDYYYYNNGTNNLVATTHYTYQKDDDGKIILFSMDDEDLTVKYTCD